MDAIIEVNVRVDQIELRNMRPVFISDKSYERAMQLKQGCLHCHCTAKNAFSVALALKSHDPHSPNGSVPAVMPWPKPAL